MTGDSSLDDAAWAWIVRRDGAGWSDSDAVALDAWLAENPRHQGALLQAEALWQAFGADDTQPLAEPANDLAVPIQPRRWRDAMFGRRALIAGGATAAVAASLALVVPMLAGGDHYATGIGEVRRVPLADGSVATINTRSALDVKIADSQRDVTLTSGEAWFEVAKDPARPFTVTIDQVRVRAVGTAFAVRRRTEGTEILVTEGVVEAWREGSAARTRIAAGQRALIVTGAVSAPTSSPGGAIDRALAWRQGRVDFVDQPIAEAAAELNRYNSRQLVIRDMSLGRERFDGIFRADDPEAFARAVGDSFDVPVDLSRTDEIVIGR